MPTLNWLGKDKVINHWHDVPYRILERLPEKGVLNSAGSDGGNRIIHGDNLEALKALLPEYEGRVDLVYIDPPYNTGNEGWVYNDNVNDPRIRRWLGEVVGKEGEDFSRHDKWLCMMYPRLQLLRKMLGPTGVIFISIDDNEAANLRLMCNEIFGPSCFQGDIAWQRSYSPRNDKHGLPREVEHLLVYSMRADWMPKALERTEEMDARYSNPDGDYCSWKSSDACAPAAATHQGMVYAIQHPFTGELLYPYASSCWRYDQETMFGIMNGWCPYELRDLDDAARRAKVCGVSVGEVRVGVKGIVLARPLEESRELATRVLETGPWPRFYFTKGGMGGISRKTYLDKVEGKLPTNLWGYDAVGHTDEAAKELKALFGGASVFQNPKPCRLIRRILQIACPTDGIVLDAFAGSGTTAQAVLQENALGASRQFVLIEMGDYADEVTARRVRTTISGYETEKRHVERLYQKGLTAGNLKNAGKFYEEALSVKAAQPEGKFDKLEGPKMDGSAIVVDGVTHKGECVPGCDGGFSFFELGSNLFLEDGSLNPEVSTVDVMRYVWHTETGRQYQDLTGTYPYLMGRANGAVYYFVSGGGRESILDVDLLSELPERGTPTVVFAQRSVVAASLLDELGIVFRQIPQRISRV